MIKIQVVESPDNRKYSLRLYVSHPLVGTACFMTRAEFTKPAADLRAILLGGVILHVDVDELPTHPFIEEYPSEKLGE